MTVTSMRKAVEKSYRDIVKGMDVFDKYHQLAPTAALRFRLLPRQPGVNMNGITLKIVGDTMSLPVTVRSDNTFELERSALAFEQDASVMPNRRADSMTWRVLIETPGWPSGTRRLGDLRLECMVGMTAELVSNRSRFARLMNPISMDDCTKPRGNTYLFFADRPIANVILQDGERKESVHFSALYDGGFGSFKDKKDLEHCDCQVLFDRTYSLPLQDRSWSDNTLVTFDYIGDPVPNGSAVQASIVKKGVQPVDLSVVVGKSTAAELSAQADATRRIVLENGFESWLYMVEPVTRLARNPAVQAELVVLIDPSGVVRKVRRREPAADQAN